MTPPLNDASRLSRLHELLPESFVEDFVNYRLFNGRYPTDYIGVLDTFTNRMDEVALEFSNPKTQHSFEKLKRDFRVLNSFIIAHFSIPTGHYEMHRDPPFLYLEPVNTIISAYQKAEQKRIGLRIQSSGISTRENWMTWVVHSMVRIENSCELPTEILRQNPVL